MRMLFLHILNASLNKPNPKVDRKRKNEYKYCHFSTEQPFTFLWNVNSAHIKLFCKCRTHFKSITSVITTNLSKECKDEECMKITIHDGPDIKPSSNNIDLISRFKSEE